RVMELRRAPDWNKAEYMLEADAVPVMQTLSDAMDSLTESARQRVQDDREAIIAAGIRLNAFVLGATLTATILGLIVAILLSRHIVIAVQTVAERARAVAAGDLTGERIAIAVNDEIGDLAQTFNQMTDSLRDLTGQIG